MKLFKPTFWQRKYSLLAFFLLPFSLPHPFFLSLAEAFKQFVTLHHKDECAEILLQADPTIRYAVLVK